MKKTLKKLIVCILVFLTILNFMSSSHLYAQTGTVTTNDDDLKQSIGGSAVDSIIGLLGGLIGLLTWPARLFGVIAGVLIQSLMSGVAIAISDGATSIGMLTPSDIFFNKLIITDINFLQINTGSSTINTIRGMIAAWYYVCRLLALTILLLILLYIGIRMAMSTIASEKAVYKKMLVDWATSLALVFLLHYIIMFTINCNIAIVRALEIMAANMGMHDFTGSLILASLGLGLSAWGALVCYFMMMLQTLAFLIAYIKRMLTVGFLIVISPLISITYSIDKIGDGKAQALDSWLKEFVFNILIQPFHCILYLVFVGAAIEVVNADGSLAAMIISILCMKFIWDGEKIVRKIFGFEKAGSLASAAASAAVATAAITKAPGMVKGAATGVRKGINFAKESGMIDAVKKDGAKIGQKIGDANANRKEDKRTERDKEKKFWEGQKEVAVKENDSELRKQAESNLQKINKAEKKEEKKEEKTSTKAEEMQKKAEEKRTNRNTKKENLDKADNETIEENKKILADKDTKPSDKKKAEAKIKEAEERKETRQNQFDSGKRNISGKTGNAITNSNTFKHFTNPKTLKAIGKGATKFTTGLALGAMAYGAQGTGVLAAAGAGIAGSKFAGEMMQNSTKTIKGDAEGYMMAQYNMDGGKTPEDMAAFLEGIKSNGAAGAYDPTLIQDALKDCIATIQSMLNISRTEANQIAVEMNRGIISNPETFDLNDVLRNSVRGLEGASDDELKEIITDSGLDGCAATAIGAGLYSAIQNAEAVGLSPAKTGLGITQESVEQKIVKTITEKYGADSTELDEAKRKMEELKSSANQVTSDLNQAGSAADSARQAVEGYNSAVDDADSSSRTPPPPRTVTPPSGSDDLD